MSTASRYRAFFKYQSISPRNKRNVSCSAVRQASGLPGRTATAQNALKSSPAETFSSPSKPNQYYPRPARKQRDLPKLPNRWFTLLGFGIAGASAWGIFLFYVTNQEKLSSSVVRRILMEVRSNTEVRELLGSGIRPEPAWYLNGEPWVGGSINLPQGHVDISFRVKGSKDAGTLYFTSIRKEKGMPFTELRYKIIGDNDVVIDMLPGNPSQAC